jgi:hypothetical protein
MTTLTHTGGPFERISNSPGRRDTIDAELEWEYGHFAVVGVILLACATLFWRFRRVGWL